MPSPPGRWEGTLPSHYEVLGVNADVDARSLKLAWHRAARKWHPDRGGDEKKFQLAQCAYDELSDPQLRRQYDETLASHARRRAAHASPHAYSPSPRAWFWKASSPPPAPASAPSRPFWSSTRPPPRSRSPPTTPPFDGRAWQRGRHARSPAQPAFRREEAHASRLPSREAGGGERSSRAAAAATPPHEKAREFDARRLLVRATRRRKQAAFSVWAARALRRRDIPRRRSQRSRLQQWRRGARTAAAHARLVWRARAAAALRRWRRHAAAVEAACACVRRASRALQSRALRRLKAAAAEPPRVAARVDSFAHVRYRAPTPTLDAEFFALHGRLPHAATSAVHIQADGLYPRDMLVRIAASVC
ncbi:hypothetical protein AB1Y20_017784 [Prymnesium parvum]|uniref:J domain-containing protein n=1 Tax=Prymnesium parvum TaxID=97485 RepID=A0AB34JML0_PRYPA